MNESDNLKTSLVVPALPAKASKESSDTLSSSPVIVAAPPLNSEPDNISLRERKMDFSQETANVQAINTAQTTEEKQTPPPPPPPPTEVSKAEVVIAKKKSESRQGKHAPKKSRGQVDDLSASDASGSESGHELEDSSEDEEIKRKKRRKSAAKRAAAKKNQKAEAKHKKSKKSKSRKQDSTSEDGISSDSSDSSSTSDSEADDKKSRRKALRAKAKRKKNKTLDSSSDESASNTSSSYSSDSDSEDEKSKRKRAKAKAKRKTKKSKKAESSASSSDASSSEDELPVVPTSPPEPPLPGDSLDTQVTKVSRLLSSLKTQQASLNAAAAAAAVAVSTTKVEKPVKKNGLEFKRVDQVFDMKIHDWKLVESNADVKDEFDCVFTVRRRLNWEGKYQETQLDIKSKLLRNALQEVFKDCRSVSLVEETPQIDPHTLFHYYDELKAYIKKTLKPKLRKKKKKKKSKEQKRLKQQIAQCKLLLSYVDEDYTATRKALRPMLKAGTITYDLVWALFKPNTIAFTPTYHNKDDPRCFKVETAYEYESWMTGIKSWYVDGKYLEYDGKSFGLGDHQIAIQAFKGHKKITSLSAYPLKYHKDPEVSN
jgi:hypothetical protein